MTKNEIIMKLCDILDAAGLGDNDKINALLGREKKKNNVLICILAVIVTIVAIAGIVYVAYRFFKPDYLEDLDDGFEDDFEDDFFEDEDDPEEDIFATED